jgi:hypothetical protein
MSDSQGISNADNACQLRNTTLERELTGAPGKDAPNVGDCIRLADVRLANHGTLDDLRRAVEKVFDALLEPRPK